MCFFLTAKTSENYDKTTDTLLITKLKVTQVLHLHAITKYQNFNSGQKVNKQLYWEQLFILFWFTIVTCN